ncbi:MAG: ABC transporter ATP-binding protein [Chloroflexi bacterium]|nr:ABC transporter ATP-binding protein [Chloroflexota bacterium]
MHWGEGGHGGGFSHGMGMGRGEAWRAGTLHSALDEVEALGKFYDQRVVSRLFAYAAPHKRLLALAALGVLLYTASSLATPRLIGYGIDHFVKEGSFSGLHFLAIAYFLIAAVGYAANYVYLVSVARVGQRVLFTLRSQMFHHLQGLSLSFYDANEVGIIMSRVQNDVTQLQEFLNTVVVSTADILSLVGIVAILFWMDVPLAAIALSTMPVLIVIMIFWQRRARQRFMAVRRAIAIVNAGLQENISGVRVIQSLRREDQNLRDFDRRNEGHMEASLRAGRLAAFLNTIVEPLVAAALATVIIYGGWRVTQGALAVGVLVSFVLYIQRFFDPIRSLTMQYTEVQRAMISGVRIFEILDTNPAIKDEEGAAELPSIHGRVKFEKVSFSYVPGVNVLQDINLDAQPGETIALVGPTGAGKSTMVSLLARFYDVTEGKITVDGHDLRSVARRSLASQMGMVLQEPFLFSGTIRENIKYARPDASEDEVVTAAKAVGAHDFILRLDKGYDTPVQERGINLSVGQRQLISFARALLANPRILILDEATANVDTQTELAIQRALGNLLAGRTSFVIAHRLSTIREASRIAVLDHGRIVDIGTHHDLLSKDGLYRRLYTMSYDGHQDSPAPSFQQAQG